MTLLGVYLHPSHQLLQQLDRVEWRLWASPPSCDRNKGKRSGWAVPSYGLFESHRSSQSVASEKVVLVNKLSTQKELSWKSQYRNYLLFETVFNMALKKGNYMNKPWQLVNSKKKLCTLKISINYVIIYTWSNDKLKYNCLQITYFNTAKINKEQKQHLTSPPEFCGPPHLRRNCVQRAESQRLCFSSF